MLLDTIKLKYFQGNQFIPDIPNAKMRSQFRGFPILKQNGVVDESVCPTGALKANPLSIDLGKCTLCGNCKGECVEFTNHYKLASTSREKLVITEGMTPEEFDADLSLALSSIENVTGEKVKAFRAPAFTITETCKWAFEVLNAHGIECDCSIFPTTRSFGGFPSFGEANPSVIEYNGIQMKEFPINTARILGKELVYCGGGYFRLFPYWLIKHYLKKADYAITYLHMRDFDYEQPRFDYLSLMRKFKSYYGLKSSFDKFVKMLNDFEWVGVKEAVDKIDWKTVKVVKL